MNQLHRDSVSVRTSVPPRTLSDAWRLAPDPDNRGRTERWFASPRPEAAAAPVPGLIQEVFPNYRGVAWYWCSFRLDRPFCADERCLLRFGAVDYLAEVWLNGVAIGGHEGPAAPFTLEATSAVRADGENLLAIRVHGLTQHEIDGIKLEGSPRGCNPFLTGGIHRPVEVIVAPAIRLVDIFCRPASTTGEIRLTCTLRNDTGAPALGRIAARVLPARFGEVVGEAATEVEIAAGDTVCELMPSVAEPHLWSVEDPNLYQVIVDLDASGPRGPLPGHTQVVRCGFRDFRVEHGYFRLNDKRIFLRSMHTAPFFPVGGAVARDPDLLRRDLIMAKAAGFNMVRFIVSTALPEQLDCADEIGLMIYEESPASWLMEDSPRMEEHFDRSVREAILRDRNHPSLTIWGLLNETIDRRRYRYAAASLPLVRSLDDTRLVLFQSGRHDGQVGVGSLCNPGSTEWEYQWGAETPGSTEVVKDAVHQGLMGYYPGMGDFHVYPPAPQSDATNRFLRTVGHDSRPVFLSEYGIGSQLDAIGSLRAYEQTRANANLPDVERYRSIVQRFEADWQRFGMDGIYPFPQDLLLATQRFHVRQRLLGFDLIRANPRICGFSLTSMLDGTSGEGVWDFFRRWKPGILDGLVDGWAPLRWCLFANPTHGYAGRDVKLEAILANEDVLPAGEYPVWLRLTGPAGVVWERRTFARVSGPGKDQDGPLAMPVLEEELRLDGPTGRYEFAATLERGGAPAGGHLLFYVTDPTDLPAVSGEVIAWGLDSSAESWLRGRGLQVRSFTDRAASRPGVLLVGVPTAPSEAEWTEVRRRIEDGSVAVFLCPEAFAEGEELMRWWPLEKKGERLEPYDSLYHKACVAKDHPVFQGLQGPGLLDWEYYGAVIPRFHFDGQDLPDDLAAAWFGTCYPGDSGYGSGMLVGSYHLGAGAFVFNTFQALPNLDQHPAADRLLLNYIRHAQGIVGRP